MTESKLKLPFDELRTLYMHHLLLQEMGLLKEVSLYALLLEFTQRRARILAVLADPPNPRVAICCYARLCKFEDRYVNSLVAYYWAEQSFYSDEILTEEQNQELYENAYQLLRSERTAEKMCYLGLLYKELGWQRASLRDAKYFLHEAASLGSTKALLELAKDARRDETYELAICYYARGVSLDCLEATMQLAALLENVPFLREQTAMQLVPLLRDISVLTEYHSLSFTDLYKRAALRGNAQAIKKCKEHCVAI